MKQNLYWNAESESWGRIINSAQRRYASARTVRMPLQFPGSDRLVYCDPALNAYVLPVPPDLDSQEANRRREEAEDLALWVGFAFEDPTVIPDFRLTDARRSQAGLPMAVRTYFLHDISYELEYFVTPEGVLQIRVQVQNQFTEPQKLHVRAKAAVVHESEVLDYHYRPFRWDACRFPAAEGMRCGETGILYRETVPAGRVAVENCMVRNEASFAFQEEQYNRIFCCERPHFTPPELQLRSGGGVLHFSAALAPGERASFVLALDTRFERPALPGETDFERLKARTAEAWETWRNRAETAVVDFGDAEENAAFDAVRLGVLQLLLRLESPVRGEVIQPCQGGSSERFYVWVWEAMCMMKPMIALGYFEEAKRVIEFFLQMQDGGCPPRGEFSSLAGAIGTTGPRWASTTGSALLLAAEYLELSGDHDFYERHAAQLLRAAQWIAGEIRQPRNRDDFPGLMPEAWATDADFGRVFVMTDGWSCAGLMKLARVFGKFAHPAAAELLQAAETYRRDLSAALDRMQRADGFIPRKLNSQGRFEPKFETAVSALYLLSTQLFSGADARIRAFAEYCEHSIFEDLFCGPMDSEIAYVCNLEDAANILYLEAGEYKKAYLAFRGCYLYAKTANLHVMQERFSRRDPGFAPWQPNGSNNGRFLGMMLRRVLFDNNVPGTDAELLLLGGIAPPELAERANGLHVTGLFTRWGRVDLHANARELRVSFHRPLPADTRIRVPGHFRFQAAAPWREIASGLWQNNVAARHFDAVRPQ